MNAERNSKQELKFIRFKSAQWVFDNKPEDQENLTICELSNKKFACLKTEKEKYASELKRYEKELIITRKLGY